MDKKKIVKLVLIATVIIGIWNVPAPAGLEAETWHIVALYLGLLLGLVVKPFSEPIITLIIIGIVSMFLDSSILSGMELFMGLLPHCHPQDSIPGWQSYWVMY